MTPKEFRDELSRLYANAVARGLISDDLATIVRTDRHTIARWIGGYACPRTSEERLSIIKALAAFHYHPSEVR